MVRDRPPRRRTVLVTLTILLLASGACALVYQQLWFRLLSLVFGVTVYAASTVLATFFAGLALGSYVAARYADRTTRPLWWYGWAEILIGLAALVTSAALRGVAALYELVHDPLPDSVAALTVVRVVLTFLALLIPATLMGATLPLAIKAATSGAARLDERVGLLYATNTLGAVLGTLLAGWWLIGNVGLTFSFRAGAAVNVTIGVVAIGCSRGLGARCRDELSRTTFASRACALDRQFHARTNAHRRADRLHGVRLRRPRARDRVVPRPRAARERDEPCLRGDARDRAGRNRARELPRDTTDAATRGLVVGARRGGGGARDHFAVVALPLVALVRVRRRADGRLVALPGARERVRGAPRHAAHGGGVPDRGAPLGHWAPDRAATTAPGTSASSTRSMWSAVSQARSLPVS